MKRVAIIGGGLAGTACAYMLKTHGLEPVIYEAGPALANGASGNEVGLYNPRFSAGKNAESDYFAAAFNLALKTFEELQDIDWNMCGSLHLVTDEKREKRFTQTVENWQWSEERMKLLNAEEASQIAGIELLHAALYLPGSGTVSPRKLCEAYAKDAEIMYGAPIENLKETKADATILACGPALKNFISELPVKPVRGQITQVKATALSKNLRCNLCYGGYISPAQNEIHVIGATFQRWLNHADIMNEDDADNIRRLEGVAPHLAENLEAIGSRAALRATMPDHFPIVGPWRDNIYVSAGHGSHGILSTLIAAHTLTSMILNESPILPSSTLEKLNLRRFS